MSGLSGSGEAGDAEVVEEEGGGTGETEVGLSGTVDGAEVRGEVVE